MKKEAKQIITFDAQKLALQIYKNKIETSPLYPDDEYCEEYLPIISLEYDVEKVTSCPFVSKLSTVQGNAVFYQLDQLIEPSASADHADELSLMDKLIYFDFGRAFDSIPKSSFENTDEGALKTQANDTKLFEAASAIADSENAYEETIPEEVFGSIDEDGSFSPGPRPVHFASEYLDAASSPRSTLKDLLSRGLFIRFHYGQKQMRRHFVPFDKSSSMGRQNTISFIDKAYLQKLNQRLLLDMDLSAIKLNLAKFYAYKGLYFTSSERISSPKIVLDSEAVIVLPDVSYKPEANETIDTITAIPPSEKHEKSGQEYTICNRKKLKKDALSNLFDGEGLICPDYSTELNKALALGEGCASYQIRMPFIKGVLHRVDFHGFIREYGAVHGDCYEIKDAFGYTRNLLTAKIILTKSMFKCFEWYKSWFDMSGIASDPMDYFFSKFASYDHALYIANTDHAYQGKNLIQLNYQFLNTLCFSPEEYDALLETHRASIKQPVNYIKNHAFIRVDDENIDEEKDEISAESWRDLLLSEAGNENTLQHLYAEPFIKAKLKSVSDSIKNKLAYGKYLIDGEIRFLSRDLLYFLYNLLKNADRSSKIASEFLSEAEFDMPGNSCGLKHGYHYAIFRSPHLSRNEQCALRYSAPENGSVRYKYLSHLKGILMLSHLSVDPLTLGGADFDGDLVKIFNNDIIRNSVLKNRYNLGEGDYTPGRDYSRLESLPVIDIRAYHVKLMDYYSTTPDFDILANTFSNHIGQLSNLSAKYGKYVYSMEARNHIQSSKAAKWGYMVEQLVTSMDHNLFELTLSDEENTSFGSRKYSLCGLRKLRGSASAELSYLDFPKKYREVLLEICLENLCPSLTIFTGMDIDAPKNNIRPNIDHLFRAFSYLSNTYNYLDKFKYRLDNMYEQLGYMKKTILDSSLFQLGNDSFHIQYPANPEAEYFSVDLIPYFFFKEYLTKNEQKKKASKKETDALFTPIAVNDNEESYQKTESAMETYALFRKECTAKLSQLHHYADAKAFENAEVICRAQYPGADTYEGFANLYTQFMKFSFSYNTLYTMHRDLAFSDWQFTPASKRAVALKRFLEQYTGADSAGQLTSFMKNKYTHLLYNFNCKGYYLLYLLIAAAIKETLFAAPEVLFQRRDDAVYNQLLSTVLRIIKASANRLPSIRFGSDLEPALKKTWQEILAGKDYDPQFVRTIAEKKHSASYNKIFWDSFSETEIKKMMNKEDKQ